MPDIRNWWTGDDYNAFARWVKSQFPNQAGQITAQNWKQHPLYRQWVYMGRPIPPAEKAQETGTKITFEGQTYTPEEWQAKMTSQGLEGMPVPQGYTFKGSEATPEGGTQLTYGAEGTSKATISYGGQEYPMDYFSQIMQLAEFQQRQSEQQQGMELQNLATQQEIARTRGLSMRQALRSPWDYESRADPNDLARQRFEEMKEHLMSVTQGQPRNWIQDYVKNVQNPYPAEKDLGEAYTQLQDDAARLKVAADQIRARMKNPNDHLTPDSIANPSNLEEETAAVILQAENTTNQKLMEIEAQRAIGRGLAQTGKGLPLTASGASEAAYWATPRATATGNYVVGKPEAKNQVPLTPEIPDWLVRASGLAGRVPETRNASNILTPSGQSWQGMLPSQQSQYAGLVDWAGKRSIGDVLGQMQMQLPQPTRGKTWGGFRQI